VEHRLGLATRTQISVCKSPFPSAGTLFSDNCLMQGDHLSGKPGNVGEFDSCQGNVRDFTKKSGNVIHGNVREKILLGKVA